MQHALGLGVPLKGDGTWLNRAPELADLRAMLTERGLSTMHLPPGDGPWQPFSETQTARMQEHYADDLNWLAAGADGLAQLTEEAMSPGRGKAHPATEMRGQDHDQEGRLGQAG